MAYLILSLLSFVTSCKKLKVYNVLCAIFQGEVRYVGRERCVRLHDVEPHQVRHHQRRPRNHPHTRPPGLPHQDEGEPGENNDNWDPNKIEFLVLLILVVNLVLWTIKVFISPWFKTTLTKKQFNLSARVDETSCKCLHLLWGTNFTAWIWLQHLSWQKSKFMFCMAESNMD